MPKLLIVNVTLDHTNWGSQACALALRQILLEQVPDAELAAVPSGWIARRYSFDPHIRGRRLFKKPEFPHKQLLKEHQCIPEIADEFEPVAERWLSGRGGPGAAEYLEWLDGIDAVVFNAEGSTYRTNYTAIKSLFLTWLARTHRGLPAFFLNGSVTLTDVEAVLPAIVRKVLPALDGVSVREPNSLRMVRGVLPELDVEVVPDSVFHLEPPQAQVNARVDAWLDAQGLGESDFFCFSLSMLPTDLRRFRDSSATLGLIRSFLERVPRGVLMARDRKDQLLRRVAAETGCAFFGPEFGHEEAMALLRRAHFLCSGRYHHLIMAAIVGCPMVATFSTSPKVQGLCELLGDLVRPPFDPTDIRRVGPEMLVAADDACARRDAISSLLVERSAQLRAQTPRMGELVAQRLGA